MLTAALLAAPWWRVTQYEDHLAEHIGDGAAIYVHAALTRGVRARLAEAVLAYPLGGLASAREEIVAALADPRVYEIALAWNPTEPHGAAIVRAATWGMGTRDVEGGVLEHYVSDGAPRGWRLRTLGAPPLTVRVRRDALPPHAYEAALALFPPEIALRGSIGRSGVVLTTKRSASFPWSRVSVRVPAREGVVSVERISWDAVNAALPMLSRLVPASIQSAHPTELRGSYDRQSGDVAVRMETRGAAVLRSGELAVLASRLLTTEREVMLDGFPSIVRVEDSEAYAAAEVGSGEFSVTYSGSSTPALYARSDGSAVILGKSAATAADLFVSRGVRLSRRCTFGAYDPLLSMQGSGGIVAVVGLSLESGEVSFCLSNVTT